MVSHQDGLPLPVDLAGGLYFQSSGTGFGGCSRIVPLRCLVSLASVGLELSCGWRPVVETGFQYRGSFGGCQPPISDDRLGVP